MTAKAIDFWEGRRVVSLLTLPVASAISLSLIPIIRPIVGLVWLSMPVFGGVIAIAAAVTTLAAGVIALFNCISYLEAQEELEAWNEIQNHLPQLATIPERIANIRAEIFEIYRTGRKIVEDPDSPSIWGRYVSASEKIFYLKRRSI